MHTAIVACGLTRFGRREATFRELAAEAGKAVFDDAYNIDKNDVDGLFVGSAMPERFVSQGHVAPMIAEQLGLRPKIISRTELACGSGQAALRAAHASLVSGMCEIALVLGVEKMTVTSKPETQKIMASVLDREWEGVFGTTATIFFAMCAQRHMMEYGTRKEQMALVSVKNHLYAKTNAHAQFQKECTIEEVLGSPVVSPPLHLLECSGITDGAAAVIMTGEKKAKAFTDTPAYIIGHGQRCTGNLACSLHSLSEWDSLRQASEEACKSAGIESKEVDIAEVHDCFSISEIMAYEGLGLCKKGEGGKFIGEGRSYIGGDVAVNTRGGLLGTGHPLGATGIAQAIEIAQQFKSQVPGKRQVSDAEIGLSYNLSGNAATHSILIYGRK